MTVEQQNLDRTILADDGRVLLMSCEQFVDRICRGSNCFVCGADPTEVPFNDEHIVPRWVLRRFELFDREITLPTGDQRKYGGYRLPCCVDCNELLGKRVEAPISQLLKGDFSQVKDRLEQPSNRELLFVWLSLLFLKTHLKDGHVAIYKDRRQGTEVIGDLYDWALMHHIHAIARSPYTGAHLLPGVLGSIQVFEIVGSHPHERYDYVGFSRHQALVVQIGPIGIAAALTDSEAAQIVWAEKLSVIDRPISNLQLREIGAMLAYANVNLKTRPEFGTFSVEGKWAFIFSKMASILEMEEFVPEEFGEILLFAVKGYVDAHALEIDGTRDPELVASKIRGGFVRFLTNEQGELRPPISEPS